VTASGTADDTGTTGATERGVPDRLLLLALALGAFAIRADSLVISGLLVRIATGLHVSATTAAQLISVWVPITIGTHSQRHRRIRHASAAYQQVSLYVTALAWDSGRVPRASPRRSRPLV
jgi:hypothetical protein